MKIIISADGRKLCASTGGQPLTSGSVGIEAAFVLSADYDGLAVTAVFRAGDVSVDVLLTGPSCIVPWEVLETSGHVLIVGVVGKNGSGEIVIPTIWGRVGMVECGTVAEGIDPQDPTPDIAAQLLQIAQETVERAETAETAATEAAAAAGESATAAGEAKTDAETAAQDAEAARQAIEDLSVEAHADPDGPSVEKTVDPETGAVTLDFGIPPAPEVPVQSVNGKTGAVQLTLDDIPDGEIYARTTPAQVQQIGTNANDIGTIEGKIPAEASAQNQLADKAFVNSALASYRTAAEQDEIDDAQDDRLDDLEQATTAATVGPTSIVTFDASAADMPLKQVVVDIEPVQDLHGYDAPWPAGGRKNIFPSIGNSGAIQGITFSYDEAEQCYTLNGTTSLGTNLNLASIPPAQLPIADGLSGTKYYTMSVSVVSGSITLSEGTGLSFAVGLFNGNASSYIRGSTIGTTLDGYVGYKQEGTPAYGNYNLLFQCWRGTVFNNLKFRVQIEIADDHVPSEWTPYSNICPISGWTGANIYVSPTTDTVDGITYSITFPTEAGTVYGGALTINADGSGELVVNMAEVDLGTLNYSVYGSTSNYDRYISSGIDRNVRAYGAAISDEFKAAPYGQALTANSVQIGGSNVRLSITTNVGAYTDAAAFKAAMSGVQLIYELATPIPYQLTAQQVTTLLGTNNVWADCGDVTVAYGAYLETLKASLDRTNGDLDTLRACIAPIEDGATASKAYAAGAYFFRNGSFCTALTAISSGAAFTLGTNYQTTTVAAALIALQS